VLTSQLARVPRQTEALLLGGLGVAAFSLTLPATKLALHGLEPTFVSLGRALVAAVLAVAALAIGRPPRPRGVQWVRLGVTGLGVVVGFPLLTAFALQHITASHSAVIVGLLPAATAIMAVLRAGERPSSRFWLACAAGLLCVLAFAWTQGAGGVSAWDLLVLLAIALAGLGYAEGAALSRELGALPTLCWVLVLAAPFLVLPVARSAAGVTAAPVGAWLGFAYVAVISMFAGFVAWYRGLALGGAARVGQLQLAQPVLTLTWSAMLLGEQVGAATLVAAFGVIGSVALTQRLR
jgi:drug/metabolite transporter (DMT)-like permease